MIARAAWLLLVACLGCEDEPACSRDEECGAFQRCIERECRPLPRSDASVRDAGRRNDGARDAGLDAGPPLACAPSAPCPTGYACVDERCVCGEPGTPCCAGTTCRGGDRCDLMSRTCGPCGASGEMCCAGGTCGASTLLCDPMLARCVSCGSASERCCASDECTMGLACVAGVCRSGCGRAGEPCCGMGGCAAGLMCTPLDVCE